MKHKFFALALALLLPATASAELIKDETVYALLDNQGAATQVLVVNRLETPEDGEYLDAGTYTEVTALTQDVEPKLAEDTVAWSLRAAPEGFAYVGALETAQLPYLLTLSYALDGSFVAPEDLIGKAGQVEITLNVAPNPESAAGLADRLMVQIQVPLSRLHCADIEAPGASSALVGDTQTLSYTVLPGQSATHALRFTTQAFEMDSIQAACVPISLDDLMGTDLSEMSSQSAELEEGANTLAEGATVLQEGVTSLVDGVAGLSDGASTLADNGQAFADGLTALSEGIDQANTAALTMSGQTPALSQGVSDYVQGVQALVNAGAETASGADALAQAGSTLYDNYALLANGLKQSLEALTPLMATLPEVQRTALSQQLQTLSQQVDAYAQGLQTYTEQAAQLSEGLGQMAQQAAPLTDSGVQLAGGVSAALDGLSQLSAGLSEINAKMPELAGGAAALADGQKQLADGLEQIRLSTVDLPNQMTAFADGQAQLSEGIAQAVALLTGFQPATAADAPISSFVNPSRTVRSLQFVCQTPALRPAVEETVVEQEEEPAGFFNRLKALFE